MGPKGSTSVVRGRVWHYNSVNGTTGLAERMVGDVVAIQADVFGDGHDHVRARLLWKQEGAPSWETKEMLNLGMFTGMATLPLQF